MFIKDYQYLKPTIDCGDHIEIEGINREDYAINQYMDRISINKVDKPTAVLYAAGFSSHQMESRDPTTVKSIFQGSVKLQHTTMVIKESTVYAMHKWIGSIDGKENIVYANINGNACASSMYSLYEAQRLLNEGVCKEVIIITEERTSFNTLRIFKEHRIPLVCGDALAIVTLTNEPTEFEITDTKWEYQYNNNPFLVTKDGYSKVDTNLGIDSIKPHGTKTPTNDDAETDLVSNRNTIYYKSEIGHAQGASALLEICMLLDDKEVSGNTLCVASGLGGFYGSCILRKPYAT